MCLTRASRWSAMEFIRLWRSYYSNVSRGRRQKEDQDGLIPYVIELQEDSKEYRKNWARLIQKMGVCPRNPLRGIAQGGHIPLGPFSISLGLSAFCFCQIRNPQSQIPNRTSFLLPFAPRPIHSALCAMRHAPCPIPHPRSLFAFSLKSRLAGRSSSLGSGGTLLKFTP